MPQAPDDGQFLLATLPPSRRQVRLALAALALLVLAFAVAVPFQDVQLPRIDAFLPALLIAIIINDLITSALLYSQFAIARQRALLALAIGYLFTALMVIPYALTFPGLFAPTGLLGTGLQSTTPFYAAWHMGLPTAVIAYVLLRKFDSRAGISTRPKLGFIRWSAVAVIAMVSCFTLLVIVGEPLLPIVMLDPVRVNLPVAHGYGGVQIALYGVALVSLWVSRRSTLDLWLMILCSAMLLELILGTTFVSTRYSLGWYAGRAFSYCSSLFVLLVLLSETTALYATLARSAMRQRTAGEMRQIAIDVMAASIAHEIKQPIAGIILTAQAGRRWLERGTPDVDKANAALGSIIDAASRADELISSIRSMYRKGKHGRASVDVNDLVREALALNDVDLRVRHVTCSVGLRDGLPRLLADRGQLQQVMLNLITNAIEAMRDVKDRPRMLLIRSDLGQDDSSILITIEDSGCGINEKDANRIFEPFFTTKSTGTGIGLNICRSIIESHGGSILVSANSAHGTIFHLNLPIK